MASPPALSRCLNQCRTTLFTTSTPSLTAYSTNQQAPNHGATSMNKEPSKLTSALGEAMGALIILLLLLPLAALSLRATVDIVRINCEVNRAR
ncbi:hypothetical protein H6G93_34375 [Nostoc sp. FACHB-973]|nr:hypothetical protein [Nostoc sp. FACHB-973]